MVEDLERSGAKRGTGELEKEGEKNEGGGVG